MPLLGSELRHPDPPSSVKTACYRHLIRLARLLPYPGTINSQAIMAQRLTSSPNDPMHPRGLDTRHESKSKMQAPEELNISLEQGESIIERLEHDACTPEDRQILVQVLRLYFWLIFALQESKLSLKRLRIIIFGKPKNKKRRQQTLDSDGDSGASSVGEDSEDSDGHPGEPAGTPNAEASEPSEMDGACGEGDKRPGHGRLGAEAYVGAERVECRHEELAPGDRCPLCGHGTLYPLPPSRPIRIDGHAALSAIRYELERLRCSACGEVFGAKTPAEAGASKYNASARAAIVMNRYFLGVPFYRLEAYQALVGVPVPDSTQWDQVEHVADCAYMVFEHLVYLAAQGHLIYQDDTPVRILSLIKENLEWQQAQEQAPQASESSERTGMQSTALVVKTGEHTICLYFSGRDHAGENLQALLEQRQGGLDKPIVMSDALSRNEVASGVGSTVGPNDTTCDEARLIRCHCLAHARRKFSDIEETFPEACDVVITALKDVFDHEEAAQKAHMSDAERLAHHQTYSEPILNTLETWMEKQFKEREVEPNSSLGKALTYMLSHWRTLTQFLSVPGAPLGRVDDWRGVRRFPVAVVAPFGDDASVRLTLAPFPAAARRTGRADLPHPALIQDLTSSRSTGFCSALAA
jgi:transposase